jgi:hypothetical protein
VIDLIAVVGTKKSKIVHRYRGLRLEVFESIRCWRDNVEFSEATTIHLKIWDEGDSEEQGDHLYLNLHMVVETPEEAYHNIKTILRTIILVTKVEITW